MPNTRSKNIKTIINIKSLKLIKEEKIKGSYEVRI